ncbi:MAG: hypothetical protein GY861_25795 [bacterium]|nr:hypothetical protein [bacterium]
MKLGIIIEREVGGRIHRTHLKGVASSHYDLVDAIVERCIRYGVSPWKTETIWESKIKSVEGKVD